MIFLFVVVLLTLNCLVGRWGHMVLGDQLLIADHFIGSVNQATVQLPAPINTLALDAESQEFNEVADIMSELHHSLRFEPSKLDFGPWSIGIARSYTVTLVNHNENKSVYLSSVSGKTSAFYSSFFEAKVVPPQGNTTFNVVFLPRVNGAVTTNLLIHTSFGEAKLLVSGEGRECPYRLKPILGIKVPLNATLTPDITMYNPHNYVLQILEVYSSGTQFQLELPSGGQEGPKSLWEISPYATKPIIRIRFKGNQSGNCTGFIRIKVESLHMDQNAIVIPIEIEVLAKHGIYAANPVIDFHRITTHDPQKVQKIHLKDSLNSLEFHSEDINMEYEFRKYPGLTFNVKEGTITLDPLKFQKNCRIEELLIIKASSRRNNTNSQEFSLLIRAEVFKGSLEFDKNITMFITKSESPDLKEERSLEVKNQFSLPLAILNATVDPTALDIMLMTIKEIIYPQILQPGEIAKLSTFRILNDSVNFRTSLYIYTNITTLSLPVIGCPGTLHVQTLNEAQLFSFGAYNTELNMGIVPFAEMSQDGFILLQNRNPLNIKLSSWDFQTPQGVHFHTTFLGCLRGSLLKSLKEYSHLMLDTTKFKFCTYLGDHDVAAFQIAIKSYITEVSVASLKIWTPLEVITAKVTFKTWIGKLEVDQQQIYFKNCFPGRLCSSDLSIRSTFLKPIRINSINFSDKGLRFEDFDSAGSWISPETTSKVGRIYFEPAKLCEKRCYIPNTNEKWNKIAFAAQKIGYKGIGNNNYFFDDTELRRRTELFRHLKWYFQTISFSLNSSEIRQFQLYLIIDIEWPKLVKGKTSFPTTEVGKEQIIRVNLTNPAMDPILIDYFLSDPKFSKDTQLSLPLEVVDICTNCYLTDQDVFVLGDGAPTKPFLLPAGFSKLINVRFLANEPDVYSTLLHIRNNLTLYEAVWLSAKTVQSQFKFGNRKPGSNTPLLFEVNEKHLPACTDGDSSQIKLKTDALMMVIKRTFTARNTGEIPIWIESFLIGGKKCQGFGFKVFNCSSFVLHSNSSKKIEIGFSPDFTLARTTRQLTLITNLSYDVNYLLVAVMPSVSLELCSEILSRPHWEAQYKVVTLMVVGTSFVLVMVAAHIDYANILLKQTDLFLSRDKGNVHQTFNLRTIAIKAHTQTTANEQQTVQSIHKSNRLQNRNSNNNLKKRGVKKNNSNGGCSVSRNMLLSNIAWPLELAAVKGDKSEKAVKSTHTSSERDFPIKLGSEKISSSQSFFNSSTSISSSESSAKSTPPKQVESTEKNRPASLAGSKKQKLLKKPKKCLFTVSNENNEKENERPTSQKATTRSSKQISKSRGQSVDINRKDRNEIERINGSETVERVAGPIIKQKVANANDLNETCRKYDKTPGRERRKEFNNFIAEGSALVGVKYSEHKQDDNVTNSLNSNSSPPHAKKSEMSTINSILCPWKTSKDIISFSHVLQSHKKPITDESSCIKTEMVEEPSWSKQQITAKFLQATDAQSNGFEKDVFHSYSNKDNLNSTELGPIGSKKSPSSTPVWAPLSEATKSVPSDPKPTLLDSSFFSNLLPYGYTQDSHSQHLMDLSQTGLYELKKAQENLHRQWQANEYFFNMHQHQLPLQQPAQGLEVANNWGVTSQTWAPMNYRHNATNTSWQRTTTMRPPPGLEQNFISKSATSAPVPEEPTTTSENAESSASPVYVENIQSMPTFDPFSSLSSIWSENWNKNHRNEMN